MVLGGWLMKYKDQKIVERLYKKTRELLLIQGVKGWNMNTLAAESGIAKSTLYRIINSKEELVLSIILEDMRQIEIDIKKILLEAENADVTKEISNFASEKVPLVFGNYLKEAILEYPELEDKVKENEDTIRQIVFMFLEYGQQRGQIKKDIDPLTIFELLMGIILHFVRIGYSGDVLSKKIYHGFNYIFYGIRVNTGE